MAVPFFLPEEKHKKDESVPQDPLQKNKVKEYNKRQSGWLKL